MNRDLTIFVSSMTVQSPFESFRPSLFWLIFIATVVVISFGCENHSSDPEPPIVEPPIVKPPIVEPPAVIEFFYPRSTGTSWRYQYHYYYTKTLEFKVNQTWHHALHTWEVVSVTTSQDSTVALVRAIRADTLHVVQEPWNPSLWILDTTYVVVDTVSFPMVFTSASIVSKWSKVVVGGPYADWIHTVPRQYGGGTFTLGQGNFQAWYSNDTGLTRYTGGAAANFWWADTLLLVGFSKK
jgi:hypothetical protein